MGAHMSKIKLTKKTQKEFGTAISEFLEGTPFVPEYIDAPPADMVEASVEAVVNEAEVLPVEGAFEAALGSFKEKLKTIENDMLLQEGEIEDAFMDATEELGEPVAELTMEELEALTKPDAPEPTVEDVAPTQNWDMPATATTEALKTPRKSVKITLPAIKETPAFVGYDADGTQRWFKKTALISWMYSPDKSMVEVEMKPSTAKTHGLIAA